MSSELHKSLVAKRDLPIVGQGLMAVAIGCLVFLFHALHIPAVAKGAIFNKSNLAFDFDVNRFVGLWCASPFPESENEAYFAVRHPLAVTVRLVCAPLVSLGINETIAACAIAAACAALSAVLTFKIARALDVPSSIACGFALLWTLSTTTLVLGVLPEAYGLALVALAYQFLLAVHWVGNRRPNLVARLLATVANFGITVTNGLLSGLTELIFRGTQESLPKALRNVVAFGAAAGILAVALSAGSFAIWRSADVDSPVNAARQLYWSANAYSADQRQNLPNVVWEFAATSFVAPAMARYPTGVPDNPYLWDFRGQNYSAVGWAAVLGWLALLAYGAVTGVKDKALWPLLGLAAAWITFNILLHAYWQFRGSIFVYSAHPHSAFLILAMAGARRVGRPQLYAALVVAVALLMALNNVPMYLALGELN